jgi:hypothetical protein
VVSSGREHSLRGAAARQPGQDGAARPARARPRSPGRGLPGPGPAIGLGGRRHGLRAPPLGAADGAARADRALERRARLCPLRGREPRSPGGDRRADPRLAGIGPDHAEGAGEARQGQRADAAPLRPDGRDQRPARIDLRLRRGRAAARGAQPARPLRQAPAARRRRERRPAADAERARADADRGTRVRDPAAEHADRAPPGGRGAAGAERPGSS